MLRRALIRASRSPALRRIATTAPAVRRVAERFVAGEMLDDAVAVARALNGRGLLVSLDHVGEAVTSAAVARAAAAAYRDCLERIGTAGLDASLSVKLSQLGAHVAADLVHELTADLCVRAAAVGQHVTVDMEGSDLTQTTVDLVARLCGEGHDNVGCALQAYLFRTVADVRRLTAAGASLRLCKGAYAEPPRVAYQRRADIDASYARLADWLLRHGHQPRFATHDHRLIGLIRRRARRHGVISDRYEFQMLYGVREPLQDRLAALGHPVRVYVPYGPEWYPYFVRRIAERPANLLFFLRALGGLVGSRGRR